MDKKDNYALFMRKITTTDFHLLDNPFGENNAIKYKDLQY